MESSVIHSIHKYLQIMSATAALLLSLRAEWVRIFRSLILISFLYSSISHPLRLIYPLIIIFFNYNILFFPRES